MKKIPEQQKSEDKTKVQPEVPIKIISKKIYYPQIPLYHTKWGGVQRNPVCSRIDHMNQNFYDF
jgi:hypothetical protein